MDEKGMGGLWRKKSKSDPSQYCSLSVYVDDNLLVTPSVSENRQLMREILAHFAGRELAPVAKWRKNGMEWIRMDVLGVDIDYCREAKELKIHASSYSRKLLAKYKMTDCRVTKTVQINAHELLVNDTTEIQTVYPLREVPKGGAFCEVFLLYILTTLTSMFRVIMLGFPVLGCPHLF
jgi:hypothetical protein